MHDTKIAEVVTETETVEAVDVNVDRLVVALKNEGTASASVALELTDIWPMDDNGKRSKAFYVDHIAPKLSEAGFTLSYDSARVYASVVDTYGDRLLETVSRFGWTQANEAARGGNTGNGEAAQRVLEAATRDENGKPKLDSNGNMIRPTVADVKATARDLAIPDGKSTTKPKPKPKPLTVANLTQADIRKHDTEAVTEYRAKLAEQLKRADNVLRARKPKQAAA